MFCGGGGGGGGGQLNCNQTRHVCAKVSHQINADLHLSRYTFVTVPEKTRYESRIAISDNTHLKVQTVLLFAEIRFAKWR